jgi:hypothetical protein
VIDINDNLGILKIQSKEPPIMYDQQTEITLEKLKQWIQMEAETKEPVYDEGGDQGGTFFFFIYFRG